MNLKFLESTLAELYQTKYWSSVKKLHKRDWRGSAFEVWYNTIEMGFTTYHNKKAILVLKEDKPIAICLYSDYRDYNRVDFACFVTPYYRRNGIGTELFNMIKNRYNNYYIKVFPHDKRSYSFYDKIHPNR